MNQTVVTEETGLRIWPTHSIVAFLDRGECVHAAFRSGPVIPDLSPGSLTVSDKFSDGVYKKKIIFKVPLLSSSSYSRLLSLSKTYIVVGYTDERGVERLMGTTKWPGWLSLEISGGSVLVSVEATGDAPNPRFIKAEPCR